MKKNGPQTGWFKALLVPGLLGALLLASSSCGTESSSSGTTADDSIQLQTSQWTPAVSGASSSHHDGTVEVTRTALSPVTAHVLPLNGVGSSASMSDGLSSIATVQFTLPSAMGSSGSFTLSAQALNTSALTDLSAGATVMPVLISLTDPVGKEFVQLSSDCLTQGLYSCASATTCSLITSCSPGEGSAFLGATAAERRSQWEQHHQAAGDTDVGVVLFPTCRWSGSGSASAGMACPFDPSDANSFYGSGGELRAGTYTAQYFLVSNLVRTTQASANTAFTTTVDLQVHVTTKKDADSGSGIRGALDLNIILVGTSNVNDGATLAGQRNLNALFTIVHDLLKQTNSEVYLGTISAYDWDASYDGDAWADLSISETGDLFYEGTRGFAESQHGQAVNLFLVNRVTAGSSGTILGRAGGVPGPPMNGTLGSGIVIPTFENLANYNPLCTGQTTCPTASQDASFLELGATIAHEIGHYLALNHPSERDGETHDAVLDTPICTALGFGSMLTVASCLSDTNVHPTVSATCSSQCPGYNGTSTFCPSATACQFNHVMWWTDKGIKAGGAGDGNLFSEHSGDIINLSPFVR